MNKQYEWNTYFRMKLQRLAQSDCGDNSCMFAGRGKGGMRTNGGCRCYHNMADEFTTKVMIVQNELQTMIEDAAGIDL